MKNRKKAAKVSVIRGDLRRLGKRFYSVPELIRLTGLSRRQIDYWASVGLVGPLKETKRRGAKPTCFYSAFEALKLLIFSDVKQRGFSLSQIRELQRNLTADNVPIDHFGTYLLTDGITIFYARSETEVVDILKSNRQMLLIPISEQIERLKNVAA